MSEHPVPKDLNECYRSYHRLVEYYLPKHSGYRTVPLADREDIPQEFWLQASSRNLVGKFWEKAEATGVSPANGPRMFRGYLKQAVMMFMTNYVRDHSRKLNLARGLSTEAAVQFDPQHPGVIRAMAVYQTAEDLLATKREFFRQELAYKMAARMKARGMSPEAIGGFLDHKQVPSPTGNSTWTRRTVLNVLEESEDTVDVVIQRVRMTG